MTPLNTPRMRTRTVPPVRNTTMSIGTRTQESRAIPVLCFASMLFCPALHGQVSNRNPDTGAVQPVYTRSTRTPEPSELAKDNYSRIAASAVQIRVVLVRDAGLMVELKRWVAKEATNNGQIVED